MKKPLLNLVLYTSTLLILMGCFKKESAKAVDAPLKLTLVLSSKGNDIAFDQSTVQVPAYREFHMVFKNQSDHNSEISHNVAIIKPGLESKVMEILNDEEYDYGSKVNFFKDLDYFIAVSHVIDPQGEDVIKVDPLEPGYYTYICLMPGHGNILNMKGILYVQGKRRESDDYISIEDLKSEYTRPSDIPYPIENSFSPSKFALGQKLFFDPILSKNNDKACSTCHIPEKSFEDNLVGNVDVNGEMLNRTTPHLLNLAWGELFFWDGRSSSLEEQALEPIRSPDEMGLSMIDMEKRLISNQEYVKIFKDVYGKAPSRDLVAEAISTFERGIVSSKSKFDYWIDGNDTAISDEAKKGFLLFNTKANCINCHSSWRFTDDSFHDIGLNTDDIGRGKILPQLKSMKFAFKTPGLRNIVETSPYFHDGSMKTVRQVLEFYNRGGDIKRESLSDEIEPLGLNDEEMSQIEEFLKTLSSKVELGKL